MGSDYNNRQAANWGGLNASRLSKGVQEAIGSVDQKQKKLVTAIASIVYNAVADLYGDNKDPKYRYIVDLILDRVRDALSKQLSNLSDAQLEAASKKNEALLKSIGSTVSGIVREAADKLQSSSGQDTEALLSSVQKKLDGLSEDLKSQMQKSSESKKGTGESSKIDDLASSQQQTEKSLEELKQQLSKQFSADNASNASSASLKKTGKNAFEAASSAILSRQLALLAKNQKIISQNMTKKFEKTNKIISSDVDKLNKATSTSFYNLNDKLEDSLAKFSRQTIRLGRSIVAGVVSGTVVALTFSLKKTFGAVFGAIAGISKTLFSLFKAPVSFVGNLLKKVLLTPVGMFIIGWFGKKIWKNIIVPIWNWLKPIGNILLEWFGKKTTFSDMLKKIAGYVASEITKAWDGLKNIWKEVKEPIKKFLEEYFGYDGQKSFLVNIASGISNVITQLWEGKDGKGGLKNSLLQMWQGKDKNGGLKKTLSNFWRNTALPSLKEWVGCDPNKPLVDFLLDLPLGHVKVLGEITIRKVLYALGAYLAINGGVKLLGAFKAVSVAFKGVVKTTKATANLVKKTSNALRKAPKPKVKMTRSERVKLQPRDAKGRFVKKTPKIQTPKTPVKAPNGILSKSGQMAKKGAKFASKALGVGLVVADAGMNLYDAYGSFKEGDVADGLSQVGFGSAKAATLAAGPLAPIAYGAVMTAEIANDVVKASSAEIEAITDDLNEKIETDFKEKVIDAIKVQGEKSPIDQLLDKYKNFDAIKAKADPLTEKLKKLEQRYAQMSKSIWNVCVNGDEIRQIANQIDDIRLERDEMLAKAGLNLSEIQKGKNDLLKSRHARSLFNSMDPQMKERFQQLMTQNAVFSKEGFSVQWPNPEKILEQMQSEFGNQTQHLEENIDDVGKNVKTVIQLIRDDQEERRNQYQSYPQMFIYPTSMPVYQQEPSQIVLEK